MKEERPWQLAMFSKGLKKNLRLKSLKRFLGDIRSDERCLLLTCGDNNGAINFYLRELGGNWSWADLEAECLPEMSTLLGDTVHHAADERLPFDDRHFHRVISIDVHEHVDDPNVITREINRVARPGGQVLITVPNGDESKLAVRIKHALKMTPEAYGHKRVGFTVQEVEDLMTHASISPQKAETYSRFVTEILELSINFMYVKVLKKSATDNSEHAEIAPTTERQLDSVSSSYRIYSLIFPVYWLLSKLDLLLFTQQGYCVMVEGRKGVA